VRRPSNDDLQRAVAELASPIAAPLGIEVLEVVVKGQQGSRMVRLIVDAADPDPEVLVGIDDIATLSRELDAALDEHDPIAGAYTLEVTSPGADRPLTRPRDFARNRGRTVRLELRPEGQEQRELVGELTAADPSTLTLTTDDGDRDIALCDVVRGHVVLPW
jgi:ribosome maturation factor RimP